MAVEQDSRRVQGRHVVFMTELCRGTDSQQRLCFPFKPEFVSSGEINDGLKNMNDILSYLFLLMWLPYVGPLLMLEVMTWKERERHGNPQFYFLLVLSYLQ